MVKTVGSCFCKKVQLEFDGEPIIGGLCHCADCRKLSGSLYSYSFVVRTADFRVIAGEPKSVQKDCDSGNVVRNYFCGDCGSPLYGRAVTSTDEVLATTLIRAGIFDDPAVFLGKIPQAELFVTRRPEWLQPVEGAGQVDGMMPLPTE